jgi:hypothetical protein
MKSFFWIAYIALIIGFAGVVANVFTGFGLTRQADAEANLHLTIALSAVAILILSSIGLIRVSQKEIDALQEKMVVEKKDASQSIVSMNDTRSRAVYLSLFLIVCCVINLISGTISQSGRFPIVHGLFGFTLLGLAIGSLILWVQVARSTSLKD